MAPALGPALATGRRKAKGTARMTETAADQVISLETSP